MHLQAGSLLGGGKYKIEKVLGQGGFGITYLAEQTSLGRKVALKEFFMEGLCNRDAATSHVSVPSVGSKKLVERFKQKFIKEARMIASFDNNHIISIYDVFEENGTAYYVMEYLGGKSLSAIVNEQGIMSETLAMKYIRQVADALAEVHANNLLHLDVKPANIMLNKKGEAVLIDFGISKHYDEAGNQTSSALIGTSEGYAPLEQYEAGALDSFTPATDIYALGATLFFLLTGTRPPKASEVMNYGLPELPEGVSASVRSTIETAMQPAIAKRPQSIAEFLCLAESGKMQDESDGETVLNGNVKGASKREGENLFTHTASESSFDEVKGENGKLVADEFHSIDVVEVPDSADAVISNESEKSNSASIEILPPYSRQNDKDGNEEVERRNEKERPAGVVISNGGEKSQKNKPGKSLWLILLLLLIAVAGAWFLFGGTGNGDAPKRDTNIVKKDTPTSPVGEEKENPKPAVPDNSFKTREFSINGVSFKMVAVEGGTFQMGAQCEDSEKDNYDKDALDEENPVHDVTVSDYYIGETEVTQALWEAVMDETIYDQAKKRTSFTDLKGVDDDCPMYYISYDDCVAFVKKLNERLKASGQLPAGREFRLPTEAEWEFAARGGNFSRGYQYSGSDTLDDVSWYGESLDTGSNHPVKQKQANELGLYDMSGNVLEWCNDWYDDYFPSLQTNPKGPSTGSGHVLRGGCWPVDAQYCRVASRSSLPPDIRIFFIGLRLAL